MDNRASLNKNALRMKPITTKRESFIKMRTNVI